MLYTIFVWIILTIVCFLLGNIVLRLFINNDNFLNLNDRSILCIWLGITSLTMIFLSLSFVVPLSTTTGIVVSLIVIIAGFFSLSNKHKKEINQKYLNQKHLGIYVLIVTSISALMNKQILWYDTAVYHWQATKWLANFGTVTGVALIHSKLGFNSAWFAFSAPLNISALDSHIGAVSNGFIFFIATIHFIMTIKSLLQKNNLVAYWFISIYYFIYFIYNLFIFTNSTLLFSYSPDIPVNFFIGIIAWVILLILDQPKLLSKSILKPEFIPLFLALVVVNIKLSAIPLLLTFFIPIFKLSSKFKNIIISSVLSFVLLLPMFAYSIKTTGCLLYPSSAICFDLPWTIPQKIIRFENEKITGITPQNVKQNRFIFTLKRKLRRLFSSVKFQIMTILFIVSIILSILILRNKKYRKTQGSLWLISLAIAGMLFILVKIPLPRFGIGYFVMIMCFFSSFIISDIYTKIINNNSLSLGNKLQRLNLLTITLLIILVTNFDLKSVLIPPELIQPKLIKARINNVNYVYREGYRSPCFDAPLPCAPENIKNNIQLKNPQQGISQGFINKK